MTRADSITDHRDCHGVPDIPRFQREAVHSRNAPIMVRTLPGYSEPERRARFRTRASDDHGRTGVQSAGFKPGNVQATTYEAPPSYEQYRPARLDVSGLYS